MKYRVQLTQTVDFQIYVEAESEDEAMAAAMYEFGTALSTKKFEPDTGEATVTDLELIDA